MGGEPLALSDQVDVSWRIGLWRYFHWVSVCVCDYSAVLGCYGACDIVNLCFCCFDGKWVNLCDDNDVSDFFRSGAPVVGGSGMTVA